ncbi:ninjurin-A-like [Centruroides vittatus]|uniref:ninjurin-A-like n=1 Tax=Centruroides vittatus TaxID=120091 RepID=UPI00350FBBAF
MADANAGKADEPTNKALLEVEEPVVKPKTCKPMDVNLYATKKSVAQGMLDIALLTSNASQLRYLLQEPKNASYYIAIVCLSISITLQIVVGILLLFNAKYNINKTHQQSRAELMNNLTTIGVFLITVVNILASSFSGSSEP